MKLCTSCKTKKANAAFHKNRVTKDGLAHHCKDCRSQYNKSKEATEQKHSPPKGAATTPEAFASTTAGPRSVSVKAGERVTVTITVEVG